MPAQSQADRIYNEWLETKALIESAETDDERMGANIWLDQHARELAALPILTPSDLHRRLEVAMEMADLAEDDPAALCLRSALEYASQKN